MISLAPPGRHLGAIWAPYQGRSALGTPLGAIWAPSVPKRCPWAPSGRHRCPSGARGRHLGTNSAAKFSFREIRVYTPYISFLTPPSRPPSSPRSKIPSSLRVFIISLNPHSNPPHSTPNLSSFLSSTTISIPFLPPTFSNLHLLPWQHPWTSLGFHLL